MAKRIKHFLLALILGICSLAGLTVAAGPAGALTLGTAYSTPVKCTPSSRSVWAYYPDMTSLSGKLEWVWFTSTLFRWNGKAFVRYLRNPNPNMTQSPYIQPPPKSHSVKWFTGTADYSGNQIFAPVAGFNGAVWFYPNDLVLDVRVVYNGLPHGYYQIHETYEWQNGSVASTTLRSVKKGQNYCKI